MSILTNELVQSALATHAVITNADAGSDDVLITCDVEGGGAIGCILRYQDINNFLAVRLANDALYIYERVSGTFNVRASDLTLSTSVTTMYPIQASVVGSEVMATAQGKTINYSSALYAGNNVQGMWTYSATDPTQRTDNFKVYKANGGTIDV